MTAAAAAAGAGASAPPVASFPVNAAEDFRQWERDSNATRSPPVVWVKDVKRKRGSYHYRQGCHGATFAIQLNDARARARPACHHCFSYRPPPTPIEPTVRLAPVLTPAQRAQYGTHANRLERILQGIKESNAAHDAKVLADSKTSTPVPSPKAIPFVHVDTGNATPVGAAAGADVKHSQSAAAAAAAGAGAGAVVAPLVAPKLVDTATSPIATRTAVIFDVSHSGGADPPVTDGHSHALGHRISKSAPQATAAVSTASGSVDLKTPPASQTAQAAAQGAVAVAGNDGALSVSLWESAQGSGIPSNASAGAGFEPAAKRRLLNPPNS